MAKMLGRVNFLTVRPEVFEVIFRPMQGDIMVKIAEGLTRNQAVEFMDELNSVIDEFRAEFFKGE